MKPIIRVVWFFLGISKYNWWQSCMEKWGSIEFNWYFGKEIKFNEKLKEEDEI